MWKIIPSIFTLSLTIFLLSPSIAQSSTLLGPVELQISNWHAHFSFHKFAGEDGNKGILKITKTENSTKIKNGFVLVNFKIIPLGKFFKSNDTSLTRQFRLRPKNKIYVFFRGKPKKSIILEINQDAISAPPEVNLGADPLGIIKGASSTLHWETANADSVLITPDIGAVSPTGSINVSPVKTTLFTLTAIGVGGTTTSNVEISVLPPLPKITITANPENIIRGGSSILSWNIFDATDCTIDQGIGNIATSGSIEMFPEEDTIYTIIAKGPGGTSQANQTVKVTLFKIPTIEKLQANYQTPENTLAATHSAALNKDLDWYYEAFTKETSEYSKRTYAEASIDPIVIFRMIDENDETYILEKKAYKDGLMVVTEQRYNDTDGRVLIIAAGMAKEDNLWKLTYKYNGDEEFTKYDDIQYTNCIANFSFTPNFLDDSCWHDNDLTNFNNTEIKFDKRNGIDLTAAEFNGIDTGLGREQLLDMPKDQFSMGGWIKAQEIDHNARIIEIGSSDSDSMAIMLEPGAGIKFWLYVDGNRIERKVAMDYDFHDDKWHHIYLTYDGSSMKFYIDGELRDFHPASGTIDSAATLNIGQHNGAQGNLSQPFKGKIDDIQIYNKPLSAEEIFEKFMNGTS